MSGNGQAQKSYKIRRKNTPTVTVAGEEVDIELSHSLLKIDKDTYRILTNKQKEPTNSVLGQGKAARIVKRSNDEILVKADDIEKDVSTHRS